MSLLSDLQTIAEGCDVSVETGVFSGTVTPAMRATAQAVLPTTFGLIVPSGRSSSRATRPASSVFRK